MAEKGHSRRDVITRSNFLSGGPPMQAYLVEQSATNYLAQMAPSYKAPQAPDNESDPNSFRQGAGAVCENSTKKPSPTSYVQG